MSDGSISYSLLPRSRLNDVNELLLKHFFSNEPLGVSLGADPERDVRPWISRVTKPILDQKMSFIATEGDRIIGVLLNKVVYKCDDANIVSFKEAVSELPDNFMWHILNFMDFIYKDVDLFTKYEVDRMFVFHMIAVDADFGGRGIGTGLVKHGIEYATRHGFRVLTAETTGITSAKIFQKVGFHLIKEVLYDDYVDKDGQKKFKNLHPNRSCIIWAKHSTAQEGNHV